MYTRCCDFTVMCLLTIVALFSSNMWFPIVVSISFSPSTHMIGSCITIKSRRLRMDHSQDWLLFSGCMLCASCLCWAYTHVAPFQCCTFLPLLYYLYATHHAVVTNPFTPFTFRRLENNQITSIASGLFTGLSSLQYLWVMYCLCGCVLSVFLVLCLFPLLARFSSNM